MQSNTWSFFFFDLNDVKLLEKSGLFQLNMATTTSQPKTNSESDLVFHSEYAKCIKYIKELERTHQEAVTDFRKHAHDETTRDIKHECVYWTKRRLRKAHVEALKVIESIVPDATLFRRHLGALYFKNNPVHDVEAYDLDKALHTNW